MIDSIFNLMFRCGHRRLSLPHTPLNAAGVPEGDAYVVCLDCGKHFAYSAREMRMGKALDTDHATLDLRPFASGTPGRPTWLKFAPWILVPLTVAGAILAWRTL